MPLTRPTKANSARVDGNKEINTTRVVANRYEIVKKLPGQSDDYTTAFLCKDIKGENSLRVLKEKSLEGLHPEEYDFTEAYLHSKLNHPNIVKYFDSFIDGEFSYVVQEYYDEGDLAVMISECKESNRSLDEETVLDILVQLLQGIQYMHSQGVLHLGLNPRHIFLKDGMVLIGCFEVSRPLTKVNTELDFSKLNTYNYSPETIKQDKLTITADDWSVGCILYEMCVLKHPFVYDSETLMKLMYRIVEGQTPQLPEKYSRGLNSLLEKMLTKNPEERPSPADIMQMPFVANHIAKKGMQSGVEGETADAESRNEMEAQLNVNVSSSKSAKMDIAGKPNTIEDHKSRSEDLTEQPGKMLNVVEADCEESQDFLQELNLKSYQTLISFVYRCEADDEVKISVPVSQTHSVDSGCAFFYFGRRDSGWYIFPASYLEADSAVSGIVSPNDVFCVVAEIKPETITVDDRGRLFTSEVDNRVHVDIPEGAVDAETDFTFRLESVDKDRYRLYGEHLPDVFSCFADFPIFLNIEHEMIGALKQKARVYLPVTLDRQDTEILFLHWEGDSVTPVKHKEDITSSRTCYYVEVDHFCGFSVLVKRIKTSISEAISRIKIAFGKTSICTILTFIFPGYIENMPGLSVVCVEAHRARAVSKAFVEDGLIELPCSRSDNFTIKEGGSITVQVWGNIDVHPLVRQKKKNGLKLKFSRNAVSNRIMVPITVQRPNLKLSNITYTANENQWDHSVHFSVFGYIKRNPVFLTQRNTEIKGGLAKITKDLLPVLSETSLSVPGEATPESVPTVPPVLSERSMLALGRFLPEETLFNLGIELGMTSDHLKCIFEKNKGSSGAGYIVLTEWLRQNARKLDDELIDNLMEVLEEIGRVDIAEIVRNASEKGRPIRSSDFESGVSKERIRSASVSTHRCDSHRDQSGGKAKPKVKKQRDS